jgi:hypothetical protein
MNGNDLWAAAIGVLAHGFAWIAHTEQIWMPMAGAYVRYLAPAFDLPDLRGPFAFLTLCYIGLRLGDMWNKRDELEVNL